MTDCISHLGILTDGLAVLQKTTLTKRMQNVPYLIQEQSLNSVRIYWLDRDKAIKALRERAEECLRANKDIREIILFGSLAEGRAVPGSDADILIILKKSKTAFLERIESLLNHFSGLGIGVEGFPYTLEETEDNPLACQAKKTGLPLAKRP